jgi:hypothetical protein
VSIPAFITPDRARRALFVTYGASHIGKVAPVVKQLQSSGVECLVIALTTAYKKAQQLGLSPLGYKDFLHLVEDVDAVLQIGKEFASGNSHPDVSDHESCCYLGINYNEWLTDLGKAGAEKRYAEQGRRGFLPIHFMSLVVRSLQPGVVVATSTPRSEQAAVEAAINLGIPTLTMVDLFAPPSDPFLSRGRHATRITVVSEEVRVNFMAAGLKPDQVMTTGSPDFDGLFEPENLKQGLQFRERMQWVGLKVIMWAGILEKTDATVPTGLAGTGLGIKVEEKLRQWVAHDPEIALIVRYHPSQYHLFPAQALHPRVYVSPSGSEPIHPLLHASDVVINQVSTVGLEAALLGKRVLHLAFSGWHKGIDFDVSSFGASESVPNLDSLLPILQSPTESGQNTQKMTVPFGAAAPRVAAQVKELLQLQKLAKDDRGKF